MQVSNGDRRSRMETVRLPLDTNFDDQRTDLLKKVSHDCIGD